MKKSLTFMLSMFLLFGILAGSFMLADDIAVGTGNSAGLDSSVNIGAGVGASSQDSSGGSVCTGNSDCSTTQVCVNGYCYGTGMVGSKQDGNRIRNQIQSQVETGYEDHGRRVAVNRSVQNVNGSVVVNIQKTVTYANGSSYTYQISINNQNQTREVTMEMEREGESYNVSVQNGLNVSDEFVGNRSQIVARLSNGQQANISVLPDQALQATLARLGIMSQARNQTNASIQLRERIHNNVPQVFYEIQANQQGKFLGIFRIAMKTNTEVDAENGDVVSVNQPWWAFLVSLAGSSGGTNSTVNSTTNSTAGLMIPVPVNNS